MQEVRTIKIAGMAGQGIKSSGNLFSRFANRSGCRIYSYIEFPSIIRGGHNVMQISISQEPVLGPSNKTDYLVALNQESIDFHVDELTSDAVVIFDGDGKFDLSKVPQGVNLCPVPLSSLAKDSGGGEILINTVALGSLAAHLGGNVEVLKNLLREEYFDKSEEMITADESAASHGYDFTKQTYSRILKPVFRNEVPTSDKEARIVLNGTEAVALGAISAGLQFASIYPMSPISNILHVLAKHQEEFSYVYKQPEDEISAINMALGASFSGARSMVATSGGGFCLMSEGYGLAGITETPVVMIEGMRGGPGTGLPTWSAQGDLRFVLHAHQDDFPRIILTPGDVEETFHMTMQAFNLAEKYQTPVVVLIDKNICENEQSIKLPDTSSYAVNRGKLTTQQDENFKRYLLSEDGVSTRSIPGVGNFFVANSDEHDEFGYSNEEIKNRNDQMHKRMKKLETCRAEDMPQPQLFGPEDADVTLVSWGSNKGSILQALKDYPNVNFLHLTWISPFPVDYVRNVLNKAKYVVNLECNYTAQLGGIIREKTGFEMTDNFLKFDGRPFYVEEIREKINSVLKGDQS